MRLPTVKEAVMAWPKLLTTRWISVRPTETIIRCSEMGMPMATVLRMMALSHL